MTVNPTEQMLFNIPEVARTLRNGESTVRAMIAAGKLRSFKIGDRRLIKREDLMKFIEEQASAAA
jgi:excisionase family DNA binding protein